MLNFRFFENIFPFTSFLTNIKQLNNINMSNIILINSVNLRFIILFQFNNAFLIRDSISFL